MIDRQYHQKSIKNLRVIVLAGYRSPSLKFELQDQYCTSTRFGSRSQHLKARLYEYSNYEEDPVSK